MKVFKDLKFESVVGLSDHYPPISAQMMFENGYGISVIQGEFSYGGKKGLYEIAVLNQDGDLCYTTEISDKVIGYLTELEVSDYMIKIQKLKK